MDYEAQNVATGRVILPDLVRAFALIGIALVNVAYIAYPGDNTYHAGGLKTLLQVFGDKGFHADRWSTCFVIGHTWVKDKKR